MILKFVALFGNFTWEILYNKFADSPFFTSDFPAAIEKTEDSRILNRIVPLAPDLALRIRPDIRPDRAELDFSFRDFRYRSRNISHNEIVDLNCLIVRCAEDAVFYRDDHTWVRSFVEKNRYYRIESDTRKLTTADGTILIPTQKIVD